MSNLSSAIIFATECHKNQTRKYNNLPYIMHPLDVMNTLVDCGFYEHEELLIAALLHDVVEDCNITITEIARRFGFKVSNFVQDVTKSNLTYQGNTREERWNYYIDYLKNKCAQSKALKIADRYCNLKDFCREWHVLSDNNKKFVQEVYLEEAKSLLRVCDNEEASVPLSNVIFKLNTKINHVYYL